MPSEARIAANRRNAKQSTGPKTDEGKQASAQNAVRHGLLAANPVFPGEDPAEFASFLNATIADLRPLGQVQRSIVSRIAHLQWKLQRIPHLEAAMIGNLAGDEQADRDSDWIENDELEARQRRAIDTAQMMVMDFGNPAGVLAKFQLYEQRLERSLRACLKELRDLRKERDDRDEDDLRMNAGTEGVDSLPSDPAGTGIREIHTGERPVPQVGVLADLCGISSASHRSRRTATCDTDPRENLGPMVDEGKLSASSIAASEATLEHHTGIESEATIEASIKMPADHETNKRTQSVPIPCHGPADQLPENPPAAYSFLNKSALPAPSPGTQADPTREDAHAPG